MSSEYQTEILEYFKNQGYTLITPVYEIKNNLNVEYICKCNKTKCKTFRDLKRRGCRDCNNLKLKELPTDFSVIPEEFKNEKWVPIVGGFISDKGKCINSFGKILTPDERGRYYTNGKLQYASILMAKAFNIENADKLIGQKSSFIVRTIENESLPTLENIKIGTREEIGKESGKKSHSSDNFKEKTNMSVIDKMSECDYKRIKELPMHVIFSDGNIWNDSKGPGGQRFLSFSMSKKDTLSKPYYRLCSSEKHYYVHKLVCMAFHPIEGKENYDDYSDLQVNHKDGNTLNNRFDNLEWVTKSENMKHAYENGLNKKVRNVLQYKNIDGNLGELVGEYISVAEASRKTGIAEHEIRSSCKNKGHYSTKEFLWKYKNEEETEKYQLKYTSKVKYDESQKKLIDDKFKIMKKKISYEILDD